MREGWKQRGLIYNLHDVSSLVTASGGNVLSHRVPCHSLHILLALIEHAQLLPWKQSIAVKGYLGGGGEEERKTKKGGREGRRNGVREREREWIGKKEWMTTEEWPMMALMGSGHGPLLHVLFKPYLFGHPTRLLCCPQSQWWCNLSPTTSRGHTHLQDAPYNNITINVLSTASCTCEITSSGSLSFANWARA